MAGETSSGASENRGDLFYKRKSTRSIVCRVKLKGLFPLLQKSDRLRLHTSDCEDTFDV